MAIIERSYHLSLAHDCLQTGVRTPRPNLMEVLENRGCGTTSPRKAIAELLEENHEGVTAEAPGEELPPVGGATAYRTSKLFLEAGLICGILMMDGARVYSLTGAGHRHHHSVCVLCGAVGGFNAAPIDRSLRAIGAEIAGQIVDHDIVLYVTCDACRAGR